MSILSSLFAGASGLEASSLDLSVIGDNIANANTIGFKGSRAAFEEALAQSFIGGQVGMGTSLQSVQRLLRQGSLTMTGMATDLAIDGRGFFAVRAPGSGQETLYTRAGQLTFDQDGYLVTLGGLRVQGFAADAQGRVGTTLGDLRVGGISPPRATETITLRANLQADAEVPAEPFDPASPEAGSNFSTSVTVYDSLGARHNLDVYFRKSGDGAWEWYALCDGGSLTGGVAGTPVEVASGTLLFDAEGRLADMTQTVAFDPLGATNPQALVFDFGEPTAAGGSGLEGIVQHAQPSALSFVNQDGYGAGELAGVQVDGQGRLVGSFSNGQSRVLGQVALADFTAPDALERLGGNLFRQTPASGQPSIGVPGSGGRGDVVAGALEQSNVDLAQEFVRMIAAQRGFQANAKTITTADQLLADLMSLKR